MNHSKRKTRYAIRLPDCNFHVAVLVAAVITLILNASQLHAQQSNVPDEIIETDTTLVGRIDANVIELLLKELPNHSEKAKGTVLENKLRQTKEILNGRTVWLTANWPKVPTEITFSVSDSDGTRLSRLSKLWNFRGRNLFSNQQYTVSLNSIREIDKRPKVSLADKWQKMLAGASVGPISFAMQPPSHLYRTLDELVNELPDYLGGGPVTILTEGALSASLSIDIADGTLNGFVQSKNEDAAQKLKAQLPQLISSAIKNLPDESNGSIESILQQVANATSFGVEQDRVRIRYQPKNAKIANQLAKLAFKATIGPIARQSHKEKLRNAALGILNYESANRYFPPPADSRGPNSATGLSWRVHILPFLGESELWQKFKLDEPWDSPANKKLLPEMPDIYSRFSSQLMMPADAPKGMTTLLAPISENTILGSPKRVSFGNIIDGSSNTVLLVMVEDSLAVPWTAPQDYKFDADAPAKGLLFDNGKATIVMGDGSTYAAARDNQWLLLFEMNDKKPVRVKY